MKNINLVCDEANIIYNWKRMELKSISFDKNAFDQYLKDMKKDKKLSRDDIQGLLDINQMQWLGLNHINY